MKEELVRLMNFSPAYGDLGIINVTHTFSIELHKISKKIFLIINVSMILDSRFEWSNPVNHSDKNIILTLIILTL